MGLVREPLDVDFVVDPKPLTAADKRSISDFIKADKLKRAKGKLANSRSARLKKRSRVAKVK
jgi:hypothetical protein